MLDGSALAWDSGGPVLRPSATAGSAIRFAVALVLCFGAATQDVFTQSARWVSGWATGESVAEEGYFHSHGPGGIAHWHPWDVKPAAAKPTSGDAPGYAPAKGGVHDHVIAPLIVGAVAPFDFVRLVELSPVVESGRVCSRVDARSTPWRVTRPRGPPVV